MSRIRLDFNNKAIPYIFLNRFKGREVYLKKERTKKRAREGKWVSRWETPASATFLWESAWEICLRDNKSSERPEGRRLQRRNAKGVDFLLF